MNVSWLLMHGRSVRGLLAGLKKQTRRIAKLNAAGRVERGGRQWHIDDPDAIEASPKGLPGDLLYVREAFRLFDTHSECACYDECICSRHHGKPIYRADSDDDSRWTPSIHMPRRFSRITLRLTDVRVERVQEISEDDAEAEGAHPTFTTDTGAVIPQPYYRYGFRELWNDTNGPGAWDRNDWVWVLCFDVIHANVDDVLADPEKYGIREVA